VLTANQGNHKKTQDKII